MVLESKANGIIKNGLIQNSMVNHKQLVTDTRYRYLTSSSLEFAIMLDIFRFSDSPIFNAYLGFIQDFFYEFYSRLTAWHAQPGSLANTIEIFPTFTFNFDRLCARYRNVTIAKQLGEGRRTWSRIVVDAPRVRP
jgi:hypothetical protein